ncbi:MAG: glycosyltransferase family 2 protein [Solirubrobacterales bacterium]|nr:glycosyltransferase family 2 protein [Solirubrobacterales bacterium]
MESSSRVAVVIPSWNCLGDLERCVESLRESDLDLELMVVDNGSTDGSVEWLEAAGVPHRPLPRNLGFAPAVNVGIEATEAPYVFVLNADTVVEADAIGRMVDALDADPALGGVQPRLLKLIRGTECDRDDPDATIYSLGQALTTDGRAREDGIGQPQGTREMTGREIFGVCGAACLLRRDMLGTVGLYDESYFAFYEDVDLNVRARVAGWRFALVSDAVVWHVGNAAWHAGFSRPDAENARLVARNRIWTQAKFVSARSLPRIFVIECGAMVRALFDRRFALTLAGKAQGLLRLPNALRGRRRLARRGDLDLARVWLGESRRPAGAILRHPVPPPGTPTDRPQEGEEGPESSDGAEPGHQVGDAVPDINPG